LRENEKTLPQRIIDAWPNLPSALRAGILAMIDAARKDG
jgi:hypothetical protein